MIPGLAHTMTVYVEDANGRYLTVAVSGVRCRLSNIGRQPGATAVARAELAALRRLLWGPATTISEYAQIEVDGVRWGVVAGTLGAYYGPAGTIDHYECDLVRAPNG